MLPRGERSPHTAAMPEGYIPIGARLGGRQKKLLVGTITLAIFVTSLEAQIAAVAAPRLVADLGGFSLLSWVFTSFMVASTVTIPIAGKLSDTYGRRPFILGGLLLFVAASAACAFSVSMPMLIACRALQGVGSGGVISSMQATIADLFPPAERGKYSSIFFAGASLAQMSGPSIDGFITDGIGWRWCFLASAPPAAFAFVFISANLPGRIGPRRPLRLDVIGAVLLASATVTLLLALAWSSEEFAWIAPSTIGMLAASAVLWVLFVGQARRHPNPILDLGLLRTRNFTVAILLICLVTGSIQALVAYLPTFVQVALDSTATASGLITTPQALGALTGSFICGQLISRTSRWRVQVLTLVSTMALAVLFLTTLGVGAAGWKVSLAMAAVGAGAAGLQTSNSVILLNAVPVASIGIASAARGFAQQISIVLTIAVMGVVLSTSYDSAFERNLDPETRAQLPPAVHQEFEDPTFSLSERRLDEARTQVAEAGRPVTLVEQAVAAQRRSVADASHAVFFGVLGMVGIAAIVAAFYRPTPLRRTFEPEGSEE